MNLPTTIFFSGLDGAGKTTHAQKLVAELSALGIKTKYVWMRSYGRAFLSLPLLALSRLLGFTEIHEISSGKRVSMYKFSLNKAFAKVWLFTQLIDNMAFMLFLLFLQKMLKLLLVIDRSPIDTLVDLACDISNIPVIEGTGKLLVNLLPSKSLVILLDVPEEIAMIRKDDIPNFEYIVIRRKLYVQLSNKYNWKMISSKHSLPAVHKEILSLILPFFKA